MQGTWEVMVTYQEGALRGQTDKTRVIFAPDHVFLMVFPAPGTGSWRYDHDTNTISFSFTELLNHHEDGTCTGYVRVVQNGLLSEDGNFTTSGQGAIYKMDGTHLSTSAAITRGMRVE